MTIQVLHDFSYQLSVSLTITTCTVNYRSWLIINVYKPFDIIRLSIKLIVYRCLAVQKNLKL